MGDSLQEYSLKLLITPSPVHTVPLGGELSANVLQEGTQYLTKPWWVSAGTALGFYRDKDFIPGDTDIDIEMIGFEGVEDYLTKAIPFEIIRTIEENGRYMQMAFVHKKTIFDVYIYWSEGNYYINHSQGGEMRIPKRLYDKQELVDTKWGYYPVPSPIITYLTLRYGKDWRTPAQKKGLYGQDW